MVAGRPFGANASVVTATFDAKPKPVKPTPSAYAAGGVFMPKRFSNWGHPCLEQFSHQVKRRLRRPRLAFRTGQQPRRGVQPVHSTKRSLGSALGKTIKERLSMRLLHDQNQVCCTSAQVRRPECVFCRQRERLALSSIAVINNWIDLVTGYCAYASRFHRNHTRETGLVNPLLQQRRD
jgi:hypothetical protein